MEAKFGFDDVACLIDGQFEGGVGERFGQIFSFDAADGAFTRRSARFLAEFLDGVDEFHSACEFAADVERAHARFLARARDRCIRVLGTGVLDEDVFDGNFGRFAAELGAFGICRCETDGDLFGIGTLRFRIGYGSNLGGFVRSLLDRLHGSLGTTATDEHGSGNEERNRCHGVVHAPRIHADAGACHEKTRRGFVIRAPQNRATPH